MTRLAPVALAIAATLFAAACKKVGPEPSANVAAPTPAPAGPALVFYGNESEMWGCVERGAGFLPYDQCRSRFEPGAELIRPLRLPGDCDMLWNPDCTRDLEKAHERVKVSAVKKEISEDPCGDIATYESSAIVPVAGPRPRMMHHQKEVPFAAARETLEKKLGEPLPRLMIRNAVEIDLDGDGSKEIVLDLTAGFDPRPADTPEVNGAVLHSVGVWDGNGANYTPLFEHFAKAEIAKEDYYASHIYGLLSGFADADGNGVVEIIIENGYHEGVGMDVVTYVKGAVTQAISYGCGA